MLQRAFSCMVYLGRNAVTPPDGQTYFPILQAVKKGDDIFIGQYLFTGNETTSVWMEVWCVNCILFHFLLH